MPPSWLPTGVAIVRTIQSGTIEGAIVKVPYHECQPVSDEQYAADVRVIMAQGIGVRMEDAMRGIRERELERDPNFYTWPKPACQRRLSK